MLVRLFRMFRVAAALVTAICTVAAASSRAGAEDTVVKVGAIPVDTSANVYYALDQGYFKAVGLDVQIQSMTSGPVIAAAVVSRAIDIGAANVATAAAARERGLAIRFIAPAAISLPSTVTNVMMVRKDSPIASAAQLNGQVIAVNGLKDLAQLSAMSWVDKHGGDAKSVKFVEVPFPELGAALEARRAVAIVPTEPFTTADKSVGKVIGNALDGIAPRFMILGWAASDAWLQTHADVAARFASAIAKASAWANTHHRESAESLARHTKVTVEVAEAMTRTAYGTELSPAMIAPVVDAAVKYGLLSNNVPTNDLIWRAPK